MTTPAYPTITEELLAELDGSALLATKGSWCTDGATWVCANDSDQLNNGFVLAICEGLDAVKNADYMSKADPATILALLQHVRDLKIALSDADSAHMLYAQQVKESRSDEMQAMRWLAEIRAACGATHGMTFLEIVEHVREMKSDAERLDSLDKLCEAYGFEGVHEGNRWVIDGPFRSVRDAIDSLPDDSSRSSANR